MVLLTVFVFVCSDIHTMSILLTIGHGACFLLCCIRSCQSIVDIALGHLKDSIGTGTLIATIVTVIDSITAGSHSAFAIIAEIFSCAASYIVINLKIVSIFGILE